MRCTIVTGCGAVGRAWSWDAQAGGGRPCRTRANSERRTPTDRATGDADDWSFVDEIRVFVASSMAGSSLPRLEIASTVAPGAVTTIGFTVDASVNLQPYVEEGSVVESSGRGRLPADNVSYDGAGVFTVHPL